MRNTTESWSAEATAKCRRRCLVEFGLKSNEESEGLDESRAICKRSQMKVKYCGNLCEPLTVPQRKNVSAKTNLSGKVISVHVHESVTAFICLDGQLQ